MKCRIGKLPPPSRETCVSFDKRNWNLRKVEPVRASYTPIPRAQSSRTAKLDCEADPFAIREFENSIERSFTEATANTVE